MSSAAEARAGVAADAGAPSSRGWLGAGLVALGAFLGYVGLYSELPVDDTDRFTAAIAAGTFQWDPAHLLMQPATVVWHRLLPFGQTALASQHTINSCAAALSLAVFWLLLVRVGTPLALRCLLVACGGIASNVLILATSGHMKLLALPFLTLALAQGVGWEREPCRKRLARSGALLGIATAFLINSIVILPFQVLAVLRCARARGASWREVGHDAFALCAAAAGASGVLFVLCYALTSDAPLSVAGFTHFVLASEARDAGWKAGAAETLSRLVFAVVQNFTFSERLGPTLRAWLSGDIAGLGQHLGAIRVEALLVSASGVLLALLYARGAWALVRRAASGLGSTWAQIAGILAFATYFNLSEPDFYHQITLPTLLLPALLPRASGRTLAVACLMVVLAIANLARHALPNRSYPLQEYAAQMQAQYGERDLLLGFNAYPGRQYIGFFKPHLPGRRVLEIDLRYVELRQPQALFAELAAEIEAAFERGGRVYVFGVLDASDWNAPWPYLGRLGLSKSALLAFFADNYRVIAHGEPAEIPTWELARRATRAGTARPSVESDGPQRPR